MSARKRVAVWIAVALAFGFMMEGIGFTIAVIVDLLTNGGTWIGHY